MTNKKQITLHNGDAFVVLDNMIQNGDKVEAIITDPPYGTIKGMQLQGSKHKTTWDDIVNWDEFFEKAFKVTDTVILFGQQPTWSKVITAGAKYYKEELIWKKNKSAQGFHAKIMHLKFFENIGVFRSKKGTFNLNKNAKPIDPTTMPLRAYAQSVMLELNMTRKDIHTSMTAPDDIKLNRKLEFFLSYMGTAFSNPTKVTWDKFLSIYKDKLKNPKTHAELIEMKKLDQSINVKLDSNFSDTLSNVLVFDRERGFHPTQKPVKLMEYLVKTYTNEGDTVLDPFMGSGSTGAACANTKRSFIGVERDVDFFNGASQRLK